MIRYPEILFRLLVALALYVGAVTLVRGRYQVPVTLAAVPFYWLYVRRLLREARDRDREHLKARLRRVPDLEPYERSLLNYIVMLGNRVHVDAVRGIGDPTQTVAAIETLTAKGWVEVDGMHLHLLRHP